LARTAPFALGAPVRLAAEGGWAGDFGAGGMRIRVLSDEIFEEEMGKYISEGKGSWMAEENCPTYVSCNYNSTGKPQATTCHISLVTLGTDPGHLSPCRMSGLLHILPLAVSTRVLYGRAELAHQCGCAVQLCTTLSSSPEIASSVRNKSRPLKHPCALVLFRPD